MPQMFDNSGLSKMNYDKILNGWSQLMTLQNNVELGASGISYCNGEAGHDILTMSHNWTIDDGGLNCEPFVTTWQTDNTGTSGNDQITIPTTGGGYSYAITWEEVGNEAGNNGTETPGQTGDHTITFPSSGTYRVSITGDFPRIYFNNSGDRQKILTVEQWGDIEWTSMEVAFFNCVNLTILASDAPNLSNVINMREMFRNCTVFNESINHWDVGNVGNMHQMFRNATSFNQSLNDWDMVNVSDVEFMFDGATAFNGNISNWDGSNLNSFGWMFRDATAFNSDISDWDVSGATKLDNMFQGATAFNADLSNWDVGTVTSMIGVFDGAAAFNQDIGDWDVSNVTISANMFNEASAFNQDLSGWDVSKVTNMNVMFAKSAFNQDISGWNISQVTSMAAMFRNSPFNQDISGWDVSNVTNFSLMLTETMFNQDIGNWNVGKAIDMSGMFQDASTFNQDLSSWQVSSATNMLSMLDNSGLSIVNYDNLLNGWSQLTLQSNVTFGAQGLVYCSNAVERDILITTYSWTITNDNPCNTETDISRFTVPESLGVSIVATDHTVEVIIPDGTDVTNLTPDIIVSEGGSISPTGTQDFTNPVIYTVTAEDGTTTQEWTAMAVVFPFDQIGDDIDGEAADDGSGNSVSLSVDGMIVAIGVPYNSGTGSDAGHVRVYQNQLGSWAQVGQDIDGEAAGDNFGWAVSLSSNGSVVAIGATGNSGSASFAGHVRVYENLSGTWTQIGQDIDGEAADDRSGNSVSLSADGQILAIGADGNNGGSGHVRVYENQSGTWAQVGQDIDSEGSDNFGRSVSLSSDGMIVAIGAPFNDGNGSNAGHVRVYENQSSTWTQIGDDIDGEAAGDRSGISVSLSADGSIVAIGAERNADVASNAGHARVYENQSGTWTQIGQDLDGEANGDHFGVSVSLSSDGMTLAAGGDGNEGNGDGAGHVRVFEYQSDTWIQVGTDIDGEAEGDGSGTSVSLSADGSSVAIGAAGNNNDTGHVRVFNLSQTTPNTAPTVATALTDQTFDHGFSSSTIDLSGTFTDADNDVLILSATSSNETVVTVAVSGTTLTITEVGVGMAIITVTANDGNEGSITDEFTVTVNEPTTDLTLTGTLDDLDFEDDFGSGTIELADVFTDLTGATITVTSSDAGVVTVILSGTDIEVTEVGPGTATISIVVSDADGNTVSLEFDVTVDEDGMITGLDDELVAQVKVYPNPTTEYVKIEVPERSSWSVNIFDPSGRVMQTLTELELTTIIDVDQWQPGIYYLRLANNNKYTATSKILIER